MSIKPENIIILFLGLLIGTLFGCGVTDWQILLKDEYKVTDWIMAICTILIVIGTLSAALYAKQSAYYAKRQFLANNLDLAQKLYLGLIKELNDFLFKLNDRCREIQNLVYKKYDPHLTLSAINPKIEKTLKELIELQQKITQQNNNLLFIMQSKEFNLFTDLLFMFELNLRTFLDIYQTDPNNIEELRNQAKKILEANDKLMQNLKPINNFFKHYFYQ